MSKLRITLSAEVGSTPTSITNELLSDLLAGVLKSINIHVASTEITEVGSSVILTRRSSRKKPTA